MILIGNLWSWGSNQCGQLGNGTDEASNIPIQIKKETTFKEISTGHRYGLAIDSERISVGMGW